ncbi:pseudouridine synthase [Rhodofomes roseus]|uniref:Pseudouridine synthase n=1 Tax=Rhodofomes roseus TaxID=34475 RepID=A0ABQ8KJF1_9APHY|nr:pseudouridine synthase [Rhodofomes roseus]KAH9837638.1 pseudouridine synthase [Rhodofomes roseus]
MRTLASHLLHSACRSGFRRFSTAPTHLPIPVLYLDKSIIAVNKPKGFLCQYDKTGKQAGDEQVASTLSIMSEVQRAFNLPYLPYVVHRLDRETTGALLYATTSRQAATISLQFSQRTIRKTYLAIVRGGADRFPQRTGVIEGIMQKLRGPGGLITTRPCSDPTLIRRKAEVMSEWELLATSPVAPLSLVAVRPRTGFMHQIRVHMAEVLDVPILGDVRYTGTHTAGLDPSITSVMSVPEDDLFLHAAEISFFRYSRSHKRAMLSICAPLPESWIQFCREFEIPLPDRYVKGGLSVDGAPVQGPHPTLEHLGGRWMPSPDWQSDAASPASP